MTMQAAAQKVLEDAKQSKIKITLAKKQVAADTKRLKDLEKADNVTFGPRQRVPRPKEATIKCERCMTVMPVDDPTAADDWKGCDTCDGRWYCPGNEGRCFAQLDDHEAFCKNASILAEALHQQHVVDAPRVLPGTKRPRTKAAEGRGRGRGRKN
jgi:hypothetical protein